MLRYHFLSELLAKYGHPHMSANEQFSIVNQWVFIKNDFLVDRHTKVRNFYLSQVERYGLYTDRNFGHSNTARFVSVHGRKVAVLEVNTGRLRRCKTVPVITGLNGSFIAVKRPVYHGLHSENAV